MWEQRSAAVKSVGAVVGSALLVSSLAACSGSSGTSSGRSGVASGSTATQSTELTTAPGKGAVSSITWDLFEGEPTSLDFVKAGNYSPDEVVSNLCDNLLRLNPDYTTSPGLATSVGTPDSTHYVYTIRPGVRFSDGQPLTAEDVVLKVKPATVCIVATHGASGATGTTGTAH